MRRLIVGSLVAATLLAACAADDAAVTDDVELDDAGPAASTVAPGAVPPSRTSDPADGADGAGVTPQGFTTITARITDADGEVCEVCVWLADDAEERARGLMDVTDLGDPVGMVFRFDELRAGGFWMFQTPTPLSIAWFGVGGELVGTADMEPCLDVPDDGCPTYAPDSVYDLALEVFQGDLADLGVGPGARMELVAGTESPTCV